MKKSLTFLILFLSLITAGYLYADDLPEYLIFGQIYTIDNLNGMYFGIQIYTKETPTKEQALKICEEVAEKYRGLLFKGKSPFLKHSLC